MKATAEAVAGFAEQRSGAGSFTSASARHVNARKDALTAALLNDGCLYLACRVSEADIVDDRGRPTGYVHELRPGTVIEDVEFHSSRRKGAWVSTNEHGDRLWIDWVVAEDFLTAAEWAEVLADEVQS